MGIEPDEMTMLANIDIDSDVFGQCDFSNGFSARGTEAPTFSFTADCMKPERVDRLRGESVTQQFNNGNAAPAAILASPRNAMRRANLF